MVTFIKRVEGRLPGTGMGVGENAELCNRYSFRLGCCSHPEMGLVMAGKDTSARTAIHLYTQNG